jgi:transcription elongation GreA/GreB family factor
MEAIAGNASTKTLKNYITPAGLQRLLDERGFLLTRERRAVTAVVAWAASNGDRSENADYQYGKRRRREIDRHIRFLTKRIDAAEVVDPEAPRSGGAATRVFFGATVRYAMRLERSVWCALSAWTKSICTGAGPGGTDGSGVT